MKRKNSIKMDKITIIRYVLAAFFFLTGVILILCEDNSDFLSSLWGMYFSISFIFIAFLCFIFIRREQLDLVFIIYLVLFGVYLAYLMPIFGYRTSFLIFIIFIVIGLSISFLPRLILKREIFKSSHSYIEIPAYILIIILISFINEISFVSSFPFILPSLIIAVIALVISIVYHVKLKQTNKKNTKKSKIVYAVLAGFLIGFSVPYISLCEINVLFDYSSPIILNEKIIKKYIRSRYRGPTVCYFVVEIDEKQYEIGIPNNLYEDYEVGDSVEIAYQEGLLGEPYYLYAGYTFH